ncbi:hypothetical protein EXS65_02970, partial [Candidatus Peribacteria bacterium]|nr:hypothetical protein [Candidatus Peribacteria bacterium]
ARMLASKHGLDPTLLHIDLLECQDRILKNLPERASRIAEERLRSLGVNVLLNQCLQKEEGEKIFVRDGEISTSTVIWTAGVRGHPLLQETVGMSVDQKGRVSVDGLLEAVGQKNIFVIGDGAATAYSGMAQTALYDANFVAEVIEAKMKDQALPTYAPSAPITRVPIGNKWALYVKNERIITGYWGWILRRFADLRVFMKLLPFTKALRVFRCGCKSGQ